MDLGARILVFLFFLMMIAGLSGRIGVCLILFAVIFVYAFILTAISSDAAHRKKVVQDRMNQTPIRSFPAKIVRMHRKEEESFDYFITFQATDGSLKELAVDSDTYGMYNRGDTGNLIFLHDFCFSFTPEDKLLPAVYPQDAQHLTAKIYRKRKQCSPHSCYITFDTMERSRWKVRVSQQLYESCYEDEEGEIISQNGRFLGFVPQTAEILDPALFERNIPQQDGNGQMPM